MGVWMGPRGRKKECRPPLFTIPGVSGTDWRYIQSTRSDGTVDWEIAILTKAANSVTFQRTVPIQVCLVAGGEPGGVGRYSSRSVSGGNGGAGGQVLNLGAFQPVLRTSYELVVGGSGEDTAAFGSTAVSGNGAEGGTGGRVLDWAGNPNIDPAENGKAGAAPWGDDSALYPGVLFGAGGGGGGAWSMPMDTKTGPAAGGVTGGGQGGITDDYDSDGFDGAANTGGGGGGAGWRCWDSWDGTYDGDGGAPSAGGSGIILIRNART